MTFTVHGLGGPAGTTLVFDEGDGCPMVLLPDDAKVARTTMYRLHLPSSDSTIANDGKLDLGAGRRVSIDKSIHYEQDFDTITAIVMVGTEANVAAKSISLAIFGTREGRPVLMRLDPWTHRKLEREFVTRGVADNGLWLHSDRVVYRPGKRGSKPITLRHCAMMTPNGAPLHPASPI